MITTEMEIVDGNAPQIPVETTPSTEVALPSIEERESALALKENTISAKEAFVKSGIPESMLEFVVNADKTVQQANLDKLTHAWASALKTAIKGKVAGDAPAKPVSMPYKPFSEMTYSEKLALKKTSPDAYMKAQSR